MAERGANVDAAPRAREARVPHEGGQSSAGKGGQASAGGGVRVPPAELERLEISRMTRLPRLPQELAERGANVDAAPRAREARVPPPDLWP